MHVGAADRSKHVLCLYDDIQVLMRPIATYHACRPHMECLRESGELISDRPNAEYTQHFTFKTAQLWNDLMIPALFMLTPDDGGNRTNQRQ
jgi:hypothetical protein